MAAARFVTLMADGERLSEALGRANAASAVLALAERHPDSLGVIELAAAMGGNKDMGRPMAVHLERCGLASIKEREGIAGRVAYEVRATPLGLEVAKHLQRAAEQMNAESTPKKRR